MTIFRLHRPGDPDAKAYWAIARSEREARSRIFKALQFERQCPDPAAVLGRAYHCTAERG